MTGRPFLHFFSWLALVSVAFAQGDKADLLLLAADDATLQPIVSRLAQPRTEKRGAWSISRGELAGMQVAVARTEGDPLNAVAVTTLAIRLHAPRLIVVFGTARPQDPALKPGDIVVSERFVTTDGMISPPLGLEAGSEALKWTKRAIPFPKDDDSEAPIESFPADTAASGIALKLAGDGARVLAGALGSTPQVNREADRVAYLRQLWSTSTEDNESGHVAGCAMMFGVPVVGFRVIEGGPASASAAGAAGVFALRFVEAWK